MFGQEEKEALYSFQHSAGCQYSLRSHFAAHTFQPRMHSFLLEHVRLFQTLTSPQPFETKLPN